MSATKEFFKIWLHENVGDLPAESEVSTAVLAQQFERTQTPPAMAVRCARTRSATSRVLSRKL
jgi:hypothetical protein